MTDLANATPVAFVMVADRDRAVAWYRDVLGLTHKSADPFGDFFELSGGLLRMTRLPDFKPSAHSVFGWNVDDIGAAVAALKARGIALNIYDGMGQDANGIWTDAANGAKVAWFNDCEGNNLSLSQT